MKKQKSQVAHPMTVWSCNDPSDLFNIGNQEINCIGTRLCTERRRSFCEHSKMCEKCRPVCYVDMYSFVDKNYFDAIRNNKEISQLQICKQIDEKLKKIFKQCKKYTLLVLDMEGDR